MLSIYNDAICLCVQVFKFLKDSASGHVITAVTAIVGLAVKFVSDKIDALQEETKKEIGALQKETRKDQAETRKELGLIAQALNSLRIELKAKFVEDQRLGFDLRTGESKSWWVRTLIPGESAELPVKEVCRT
jgi:hypothetical protein